MASCRAVFPHCFLLFLICDILWCIISGVLRYLVSYLWCFVVYSYLFFVLSCAILWCLICYVLWYLVVSCCVFFVESCGFMLFLICVYCCMLFIECCSFLLFLICGSFFLWFPLVFLSVIISCVFVYYVLKILH